MKYHEYELLSMIYNLTPYTLWSVNYVIILRMLCYGVVWFINIMM